MAEEPKNINTGLEKIQLNRILKQIKEGQEDGAKSIGETLEDAFEKVEKLNIADSNKLNIATKASGTLVKDSIDTFLDESGIGKLTANIDILDESISEVKSTLEKNGQSLDNAGLQQLEQQKKDLEEIREYGRTLSGFEKTFVKFAGGTFEDMKKSIEEGGDRTAAGIAKGFGDDLKGDFDKVLGFFGPVVGILQQIPFLGTILNLLKNTAVSILTRLTLGLKRQLFFEGKEDAREARSVKVDVANYRLNARAERRDEIRFREEQKNKGKAGGDGSINTGGGDLEINEKGFKFGALIPILTIARLFGVGIGAGLTAIGTGFVGLGAGLLAASKGLALGGLAIGAGLTAIFGAFILGSKLGAFEGMQEFTKLNLGRLIFGIGGLSALIVAIGGLSILAGPGLIAAGLGIGLVMGSIAVMGASLGSFAENIKPFETLNTSRIVGNIKEISLISKDIGNLLKESSGGFFSNLGIMITGHPLAKLTEALQGYDTDMRQSIDNLSSLKGALADFKIPQTSAGQAIADFFGVGGVDQLENLATIEVTPGIGNEISQLATGVDLIANALGNLDSDKVDLLGDLKNNLRGMSSVNLNFNASGVGTPPLTGVDTSASMNAPVITQMVSNPTQNNTNVRQSFNATGSKMGQHSSLHYPSLG